MVPAVSEEVKDSLVKNIRRRMTPQPLKIRADIEMKCFQFDGVLHIKVINVSIPLLFSIKIKSSPFLSQCLLCISCVSYLFAIAYLPKS